MSEAALHRAVAAYLRVALKPPTIWTTIGHGGGGRVRGAQLKAMGVQPGWPDILVISPYHGYPDHPTVLGIELKSGTGRISAEQRVLAGQFASAGGAYSICHSVEAVEYSLRDSGITVHATIKGGFVVGKAQRPEGSAEQPKAASEP